MGLRNRTRTHTICIATTIKDIYILYLFSWLPLTPFGRRNDPVSIYVQRSAHFVFAFVGHYWILFEITPKAQGITVFHGLMNNWSSRSKCFTKTNSTLKTVYLYRSEIMHCVNIIIDTLQKMPTINELGINQAASIKCLLTTEWIGFCTFVISISKSHAKWQIYSLHNNMKSTELSKFANVRLPILIRKF